MRPFRPVSFGRYTLLLPISTGGMGEIFLARVEGARGFEKLCVIKKIIPQLASDPEFIERFVNEAKTLVKLSHGSIAQVLDMGLENGQPYLALEYVDGKDLRKIAARMRDRDQPMPLTFVLYVMSRVLDALAYAHRKRDDEEHEIGLVHRDVSPQNVLVSYEGEVKVIDFGLVKSTLNVAKTNPSIILGKFLYMSPEQARHETVDRRSDLYSVGLCLYELIAGKNPFDEVSPGELIARVASPSFPPLQDIEPLCPANVAALVMRALEINPEKRFSSAEEFRGKILSCLLEIDPGAGPESVSRFMRDAFATEHGQERKLLGSLRELKRAPTASAATSSVPLDKEVDTAIFSVRDVAPSSAAASALSSAPQGASTKRLSGPIQPVALSFSPSPRSTDSSPARVDGETMPSIVVDQELARGSSRTPAAVTAPPVKSEDFPFAVAPEAAAPDPGGALRAALRSVSGAKNRAASAPTATPAASGPVPGGTTGLRAALRGPSGVSKPPPPVPGYDESATSELEWVPPTEAAMARPVLDAPRGDGAPDARASTLEEPETDAMASTGEALRQPSPFGSPTANSMERTGEALKPPSTFGGAAAGSMELTGEALKPPTTFGGPSAGPNERTADVLRPPAGLFQPVTRPEGYDIPQSDEDLPAVVVGTLLSEAHAGQASPESSPPLLRQDPAITPFDPVSRPDGQARVASGHRSLETRETGSLLSGAFEAVITSSTRLKRPVWLVAVPVLIVTLAVAAYFVYDLVRAGAFDGKPPTSVPTSTQVPRPRAVGPPGPGAAADAPGVGSPREGSPEKRTEKLAPAALAPQLPTDAAALAATGPGEPSAEVKPAVADPELVELRKPKRSPTAKRALDKQVTAAFRAARGARDKLDIRFSCDSGGPVGILCNRYEKLRDDLDRVQDGSMDAEEFVSRARRLADDIQAQLKKRGP